MKKSSLAYFFAILIFSIIFLNSCSTGNKEEKIKVGMSYDEVESIMGKPDVIGRGAMELEDSYSLFSANNKIDTARIIHPKDYEQWFSEKELKTIGQLIYVNWHYTEISLDTAFIALKNYRIKLDTSYKKIYHYFVNGHESDRNYYDSMDSIIYSNAHGDRITAEQYREIKRLGKDHAYKFTFNKKIKTETKRIIQKENIPIADSLIYYQIFKGFEIIFDASSGRVVNAGQTPFLISQINNSPKK